MRGTWAGPIALVLAAGVSVTLAVTIIIIALDSHTDSTLLVELLTTLAGAAVGAVATYLGTTVRNHSELPAPPSHTAEDPPADTETPGP